jgi:hypothetical protein
MGIFNAEDNNDDSSRGTWCNLSIGDIKLKAKIQHRGRGKFKILNDENGDKYINNVIDASDIFDCK